MLTSAPAAASAPTTALLLKARADLSYARHTYHGKPFVVVKEPVGLKYFRLALEEYRILQLLDGRLSLEEIKEKYDREFAPDEITVRELHEFVGTLHKNGLVIADAPQSQMLVRRRAEFQKKKALATLSNVFAIRWRGIDPERILNFLYPYTRWYFTRQAVTVVACMVLAALTLVAVQYAEFQTRLPTFHEFFGPANWIYLGITLAAVKVLHEFGHGLSCKHFGGECHEMGFMLLVFTPALYCNVSDSWMLPSKWKRAAIGAGGIYVELTLAAIATFLWWFSEQGLLNHICLSVMFVCSVSTIMFNGNPLLRFDGYYILGDLVEIPNLQQKSRDVIQRFVLGVCMGLEMSQQAAMPAGRRVFLGVYAVASAVYRWVVVFSILWMLLQILEPYGLKVLGWAVGAMGIFGLVVIPVWQLGKFFYVPGRMREVKRQRVLISLGVLGLLAGSIAFVPLPHYVNCPVEIRPHGAAPVYVESPGRLLEVYAQPGDAVQAGQPLAKLEDMTLESEILRLESRKAELESELAGIRSRRVRTPSAGREGPGIVREIAKIDEQLAARERQRDKLTILAPVSGTVLPAPLPAQTEDHKKAGLSDLPTDPSQVGRHLAAQDLLCYIGNEQAYEAILLVDQKDIQLVREEQPARLQLEATPGVTLHGNIERLDRVDIKQLPPSLAMQAGGSVATRTSKQGEIKPLDPTYQARMPLAPSADLQSGARGQAKIYTGWEPLGYRIWRAVVSTFRMKL